MEKQIEELQKEVEELRSYASHCTDALQTIAEMLLSLADNESLFQSEVNDLIKHINKNL